jgi:N-hydroxyarylamine O-acetyltransferase
VFDLPAYLARIGLSGSPSLAQVHRAHVRRIPFENLDPLVGLAVSLTPEALQEKLVNRRRGGYCFEHNLLLRLGFEALGARVEPMLARVRNGRPPDVLGPLTHLLLRVEHEGAVWHADAGFGHGTLIEPIPFGPGGPYEQAGWSYRVVGENDLLVLQELSDGDWRDIYAFMPVPAPQIDIEVNNWFTSTHPDSRMTTRLLVTENADDGTRTTLSDFSGEMTLNVQTPAAGTVRTAVTRDDVPHLLERRFGLREPELD